MLIPHTQPLPRPTLPTNPHQPFPTTSCTHRLLQLQTQLQTKFLRQELVSSVVMKQASLRRLIEEQDLLIHYLREEVGDLQVRRLNGEEVKGRLVELEEKYVALDQVKRRDWVRGEEQLERMKKEYSDMHGLMSRVMEESSTLYELKLKLTQRNTLTKNLLTQTITSYCQLKEENLSIQKVHQTNANLNASLTQKLSASKQQTSKLSKEHTQRKEQLQANNKRVSELEEEVQRLQNQQKRLKEIEKAAERDNVVLKEELRGKIAGMKEKEEVLKGLNEEKQGLGKELVREKGRLDGVVKEYHERKILFQKEVAFNQQSLTKHQELISNINHLQRTLTHITTQLPTLQTTNHLTLKTCLSTQQTLQRNIYFLQQYLILNSQLIKEVQILLREEQQKQSLGLQHNNRRGTVGRLNQFMRLEEFLGRANGEMYCAQKDVGVIMRELSAHKILI